MIRIQSTSPRVTRTTASDAEGRFVFEGLPPADYRLSATKAGYGEMGIAAGSVAVTLAPGDAKTENLRVR